MLESGKSREKTNQQSMEENREEEGAGKADAVVHWW
jgi:hypothetical protein